jgi:hypothetical protein
MGEGTVREVQKEKSLRYRSKRFFIDLIQRINVITLFISDDESEKVRENAKLAMVGGVSRIRNNKERKKSLAEDQLVGQISTYVGSVFLTGSADGYYKARDKANKNPYKGDGGVDIIGLPNVDIKGSMMRYSQDPLKYRLLVRSQERHKDWIYVLAMVPKQRPYKCHLVGWAYDSDLPEKAYSGDIKALHGAFVKEGRDLRLMEELKNNK